MNSGQTMLVIGAMCLLLSLVANWFNAASLSENVYLRGKCGVAATSIATSLIEEAEGQAFDAKSITQADTVTSQLTAVASLGAESGETYPNFNDFDDYNNLNLTYFNQLPDTFKANCKVVYINPSTPSVAATSPTWHKKLMVSVTSKLLKDTVKCEYIFSYWYFR